MGDDLVRPQPDSGILAPDQRRHSAFAKPLVRHAEERNFGLSIHHAKHSFYFGAIDVFARGNDHILGAVGNINRAIFVEMAHVAGAQPAIPKRGGCGLRVVPIAFHHHRAAHFKLADLRQRQCAPIGTDNSDFG